MRKCLVLLTLVGMSSLTLVSSARAATFGGYATGAQVTVPTTGTTIRAATGSLPTSGGTVDASLLVGSIPSTLTGGAVSFSAGVMHSAAEGLTGTDSEASQADVNLTVSGNSITADFLMARGSASCGPAVAGDSQVVNLVINGQPIVVTGNPNQTITLSNGTVVINEQASSVVGTTATVTVTALHVTTTDPITGAQLADVMLSTVNAQIDCGPPGSNTATSTTGGGWITVPNGQATFGFAANVQAAANSGHLEYNDHALPLTVHSFEIDSISTTGCTTTMIGVADVSPGPTPQQFQIDVTDGGEPGTSDFFKITITALAYVRSGFLQGGNIQVHNHTCP
jgi:hypothetical protein